MESDERALRLSEAPRIAFVPAVALVAGVGALTWAGTPDGTGYAVLFSSFVFGVATTVLSMTAFVLHAISERVSRALFAFGVSVSVGCGLLYLLFGCALGCPA